MTSEDQDELSRMAGKAMAALSVIGFIGLGAFCGDAIFAGDTFLAIPFGIGSLTFALDLWRRWRPSGVKGHAKASSEPIEHRSEKH